MNNVNYGELKCPIHKEQMFVISALLEIDYTECTEQNKVLLN